MSKVTQLANGRAGIPTQALWIHRVTLPLSKGLSNCGWLGCGGPRKENSRISVGALEGVSPERGQSAAGIEGSDAALPEQGPQLGRKERKVSRRGQDSRVWQGWRKVGIVGELSPVAAGVSQWH